MSDQDDRKEIEWLKYRGDNVPRFLRFAWTVLIVFSFYYLARYMGPDLVLWLKKSGS